MSDPVAATSTPPETSATPSQPAPAPAAEPHPSATVQRCCAVYHQALAQGANDPKTREKAKEAYRNSMPFLSTHADIRDFIACVAHGMLLNIFWIDEGPRLIAAAKAALAALPHPSRPVGRPKTNQPTQLPEK